MVLLMVILLAWGALSVLGTLGAAAVCRSGHREDVARGFANDGAHDRADIEVRSRPAS